MAKSSRPGFFSRLIDRCLAAWRYCSAGVWDDPRRTARVRAVKILNLSVSSFFDRDLQIRSMALTYSTVLSIVPALALMVAIGRGFGLQNLLQNELYVLFPSQHTIISTTLRFVDSYLSNASQGVFVGVGIIVLLWTIFSLISSIENAFNTIWDIKRGRTIFRQFTDYIAICLLVPVLLICSAGISVFMSTTVQEMFYLPFLSPVINFLLEIAPLFLAWLAFSLSYWLLPNTKVQCRYAMISGLVASIGFYILQWLFVNGQIYVSKYNAIYGSFAFLPLLLVWLQLTWLILLAGCVLTYSLQNVFSFNFLGNASRISIRNIHRMVVLIMAIVAQRFHRKEEPLTNSRIAALYDMPIRVVERIVDNLRETGMVNFVAASNGDAASAISPACEVSGLTVGDLLIKYDDLGDRTIAPEFDNIYAPLFSLLNDSSVKSYAAFSRLRLIDLPVPTPDQVASLLAAK